MSPSPSIESSPRDIRAGGGADRARRPHEGAGPCAPYAGRRPGRGGDRRPRRAAFLDLLATTIALAAVVAGAVLLAACGGSSGGSPVSSPAASALPTPLPSPSITTGAPPAAAVDVVREFWTMVDDGRLADAKRSLVASGSPILGWTGGDIAAAHFVRVVPRSVGAAPVKGATVEFSVIVWIDPGAQSSPWGAAGEHQLFEHLVRMSDGTWRMWDSGTGP